jgi:hypothetical protein
MIYYGVVSVIFSLLPLSLFFSEYLKNPPATFKDGINQIVKEGEELLVKEDKRAFEKFDEALLAWDKLSASFPKYKFSAFDAILKIRIATRKSQYYIIKSDVVQTKNVLTEAKSNIDRETLKNSETTFYTKGFLDILNDSVLQSSFNKAAQKEIIAIINLLRK